MAIITNGGACCRSRRVSPFGDITPTRDQPLRAAAAGREQGWMAAAVFKSACKEVPRMDLTSNPNVGDSTACKGCCDAIA